MLGPSFASNIFFSNLYIPSFKYLWSNYLAFNSVREWASLLFVHYGSRSRKVLKKEGDISFGADQLESPFSKDKASFSKVEIIDTEYSPKRNSILILFVRIVRRLWKIRISSLLRFLSLIYFAEMILQ